MKKQWRKMNNNGNDEERKWLMKGQYGNGWKWTKVMKPETEDNNVDTDNINMDRHEVA